MLIVLRLTHFFIVLFVLLGWLIPYATMHVLHVATAVILVLHWRTNKGQCILSQAETKIKQRRDPTLQVRTEEGQFIRSVLGLCFKKLPSHQKLELMIHLITLGCGGISLFRLIF